MFAWQYYTNARFTPFYLKQQNPPSEMMSRDSKLKVLLTVLNVLVPLTNNTCLLVNNLSTQDVPFWHAGINITLYLKASIEIVSGVLIGYAVYKIRHEGASKSS
jgi:hypothetical protein